MALSTTGKWIIGIVAVLLALGALFVLTVVAMLSGEDTEEETVAYGSGGKVALIELNEPIMSSEEMVRLFRKYRETPSVKAIVFRIDSPGGGVSASQEIYEEVRKTRNSGKPVVVSMGSVAASGGYYVACGADKIMANPGSLTGSIGVIFQFIHFEELFKKLGVETSTFKSGELKDIGSPFRKTTPRERVYFAGLVGDVYDQFVNVVATERKLDLAYVKKYADGRVFTGRQAHQWGFIDTLGTYEDAIALAAKLGAIEGTPRTVRERKRKTFFEQLMGETIADVARWRNVVSQPILQYRLASPDER
jgi:protease-4